jgi:hypothetical protein
MLQIKFVEKIKTHISDAISFFFFFENHPVHELMWKKILVQSARPQMTVWNTRIDGYQMLQIRTQNMQYLLPSHCNNCYTNPPQYYTILTLPVCFFFFLTLLAPVWFNSTATFAAILIGDSYLADCVVVLLLLLLLLLLRHLMSWKD